MFAFLNCIGKKLQLWLGPSPLARGLAFLLALALVALSLFYGYARIVQREEDARVLAHPGSAFEEQERN